MPVQSISQEPRTVNQSFRDFMATSLKYRAIPTESHVRAGLAYLQGYAKTRATYGNQEQLRQGLHDMAECLNYLLRVSNGEVTISAAEMNAYPEVERG
jgi:hypothetical protein